MYFLEMGIRSKCSLARSSGCSRSPILIHNAIIVSGNINHILLTSSTKDYDDAFDIMKSDFHRFSVCSYNNNIFLDALKTGHGMLKDIFEENVFQLFPIVASSGLETFRIISEDKKRLLSLIEKVNTKNQVEHYNIDRVSLPEIMSQNIIAPAIPSLYGLTDKEIAIMKLAVSKGYYEWPRGTDLKGISTDSESSKVTTLYHIRKAEKKIIGSIFNRRLG